MAPKPGKVKHRTVFNKSTDGILAPTEDRKLPRFAFNRFFLSNARLRQKWDLLLLRSGNVHGWKPEDFLTFKELSVVLAAIFLWRNGVTNIGAWILSLGGSFFLVDFYIKGKINARQRSIQRQLPALINLLCLALESGVDLMASIERILEKMKPSPLKDELTKMLKENRLGTSRREVLEHLAFRTNLPDIQALTSIIIQSEELGTSLAGVLRSYSEDMRTRRILRAEEIAGKAPVKILFPMMVFFFPIVFVIIFGPLAMTFLGGK
jgi:tight adherence protein C